MLPVEVEREVAVRHGDPVVAAVVVGPLAGVAAVVEQREAVRLHLDPSAEARRDAQQRALAPSCRRARGGSARAARRSGAGPTTSRSHTMSQPVGVCQVVSSTFVPGT